MGFRRLGRLGLGLGVLIALSGSTCLRKPPEVPEMAIHLYSGIRHFISLGDHESDVLRQKSFPFEREDIPPGAEDTLAAVGVSHLYFYREIGTKVYFNKGRVVLIEVQEPFKGSVQGKSLKVFRFETLENKSWGDYLERELGSPVARGSGGRFGAEALFYAWGDISFNRNGPNEIALYTDPAISLHRQKNFGREIRLFK